MQKLDKVEQAVFDAFSQIEVDTEKFKRRVLMNQPRKIKKRLKFSVVLVAALLLVALSATIYAATGGLEQFLSRFNPDFGEFAIAPLEPAIAEDQGIRLEVVGAQQIDNVVLLYVAMQDVSGENRLTRNMTPDIELYMGGEVVSVSTDGRILEFNRSTNTLYYEFILAAGIDIPRSDTLGLIMTSVLYANEHSDQMQRLVEGHWEVIVNTSDLGIQPLVWTDVQVGDIHIEYMSISPLGMRVIANHKIDEPPDFIFFATEIELENRSRNIRPEGLSGGTDGSESSCFLSFSAPIDIDAVTAVIINGVIIPLGD